MLPSLTTKRGTTSKGTSTVPPYLHCPVTARVHFRGFMAIPPVQLTPVCAWFFHRADTANPPPGFAIHIGSTTRR